MVVYHMCFSLLPYDIYTVHIVLKFVTLRVEPPLHHSIQGQVVSTLYISIITDSRFIATRHSKILTLLSLFFLQK